MKLSLTFDDVLLVPNKGIVNSRSEVNLKSQLTNNIELNTPLISSNMDSVTEDKLAIAMARRGGIGIIHRFCSIEDQVEMVKKVKRAQNILITDPICVIESQTSIENCKNLIKSSGINTLMITDENGKFTGIISKRDLELTSTELNLNKIMKPAKEIITGSINTTNEEAKELFRRHHIKKLPIIDSNQKLIGLITLKDIENKTKFPLMSLDSKGRLLVGAAIGVKDDYLDRAKALIENEIDVIVIDIAHGHSEIAINATKEFKKIYPNIDLIVGNVCTRQGYLDLVKAGANSIKVGVGSGSICITRKVTGFGVPQLSSILNCSKCENFEIKPIPIIADGGIRNSGDIVKAIVAGADTVMLGSLLAGTDETPGIIVERNGKKCKVIRGMAGTFANLSKESKLGNLKSDDVYEITPEGVEGYIDYKGSVHSKIDKILGGIKSGVSYGGGKSLYDIRGKVEMIQITNSGLIESGNHDLKLN